MNGSLLKKKNRKITNKKLKTIPSIHPSDWRENSLVCHLLECKSINLPHFSSVWSLKWRYMSSLSLFVRYWLILDAISQNSCKSDEKGMRNQLTIVNIVEYFSLISIRMGWINDSLRSLFYAEARNNINKCVCVCLWVGSVKIRSFNQLAEYW